MSSYDGTSTDTPSGSVTDNAYVSRPGHKDEEVPVQADEEIVEDPIDETTADSDAQLERDDKEAVDTSNIIGSRTRGAKPDNGSYREPGDEEGLPVEDGTSSADVKVPE
ncbi:hypothetical protein F4779DRAFT_596880 [Xylariaceae sp. FL0662B]|nr:hypothetical protein F4779DRAFT_596880 [Xylariaceae sp. FL0662B]